MDTAHKSYYLDVFMQIIGWHLNFECYFSSENEKHNSQNSCGGMMAVGDELRDESRALHHLQTSWNEPPPSSIIYMASADDR